MPAIRDFHSPGRSPVFATHGMAATAVPIATLTALDVLRAGGNAMDAAVAASAVLAVVEPQSTGIGGDCFCLYAPAGSGQVIAMNGSGRAPGAASIDWDEQHGIAALEDSSAHTVTIPGAISAWEKLVATHGTKGLDALLQPAIRLAEEGWPIGPRVASDWASQTERLRGTGAAGFLPGGRAPALGEVVRHPDLAKTLRRIAEQGSRGFYEGEVAADIVATLRGKGGLQTEEDFAAGRSAAEFVEPLHAEWNGYEVWQCPPNGQGMVALMMLGMLEALGTAPDGPLGVTRLHRHAEAGRLAYRDRDAFLADPAYADIPVGELLSRDYLNSLAGRIEDGRAMRGLPAPGASVVPEHHDTTYLCVVDRDGNACSFINSLFMAFGSAILAAGSGVMLQNRGYGFRLQRGHPNCIAPGKRPMHTIIPGMVTKGGRAVMPYGVMGGHFQPMGHSLFLTNMLEYGLDIQQAIDLPRLLPLNGKLQVERGIPQSVVDQLARLGHVPELITSPHGGGQAIWIDHAAGTLTGGSDPRKDGAAMGY